MVTFCWVLVTAQSLMLGVLLALLGPLANVAQPVWQVSPARMAQQFCLDHALLKPTTE
jgi:hypothetical protein